MRAALLPVLLLGCGPAIPLQGDVEYTPEGYPVSLPVSFQDPLITPDLVKSWVDVQVGRWISEKDTWNLGGYSDTALKRYAKQVPIIVYDESVIHGDSSGFNMFGHYIEVALYSRPFTPWATGPINPPNSAASLARWCWILDGVGLPALPHELTHTVLGDFH